VISINNAEAKNVKTFNPKTGKRALHISYLQGPPTQYYWGLYDEYLRDPGFGKLNFLIRWGLKILIRPLRKIDFKAAQKPDFLLANSSYVKEETRKYYQRDASVLWPSVDVEKIKDLAKKTSPEDMANLRQELFNGQDFWIISGRQANWKRVDLAISACQKLGENLLVAGYGAEHNRLARMAGGQDNIKFLPRYDGTCEIVKYFVSAKGFIFPSLEPFGIVPIEALAAGTPVVALKKGGALDFIKEGKNGVFFKKQNIDDLTAAMKEMDNLKFDKKNIQNSIEQFSTGNFKTNLTKFIEEYLSNKRQHSKENRDVEIS
jgi:glycosyltransferase involved in cell wall biosynthesis